jgi:NAD(P)-dependent dehydrogenase (short-subunit alcohol dehydrogenase family)
MDLAHASVLVTGGASGLGLATVRRLAARGAAVTILDLSSSPGAAVAAEIGPGASFVPADVTVASEVAEAVAAAGAPLRAVVHCAGRGGTVRVLDRDGRPGNAEMFETVIRINVIGTYNVLCQSAAVMAASEPEGDDRGVIVLTASVAAFEGQIGQLPYATSKAGIVGMTIVAARDLAKCQIRVNTIAPGVFDTPILARLGPEVKAGLASAVPHPHRLGRADEFAMLAEQVIDNPMLNGETIRLDGALRMPPR